MCCKAGRRTERIRCRAGCFLSPMCQNGNPRQARTLGVKLMQFVLTSNAFLATKPQLQSKHAEVPSISLPTGESLLCKANCGAAQDPEQRCDYLWMWSGLLRLDICNLQRGYSQHAVLTMSTSGSESIFVLRLHTAGICTVTCTNRLRNVISAAWVTSTATQVYQPAPERNCPNAVGKKNLLHF